MAGRPLRRAERRAAAAAGLQPVTRVRQKIANDVWEGMSDVEKIKFNYGLNLDQVRDLVSIKWNDADLHEKVLIVEIYKTHMRMGRSFARDKSRERETANLLRGVREALEERIAREADEVIQ